MSDIVFTGEVTVSLGKGGEIKVDMAKIAKHETVVKYILMYGLKQMLNDVHAGEKVAENKLGLSQKKLDSLYRGEVAQARVSGGNEVEREMKRMAEADVKAAMRQAGMSLAKLGKEKYAQIVDKQLESKADKYRAAAEKKLAIKAETGGETDLTALLGL